MVTRRGQSFREPPTVPSVEIRRQGRDQAVTKSSEEGFDRVSASFVSKPSFDRASMSLQRLGRSTRPFTRKSCEISRIGPNSQ